MTFIARLAHCYDQLNYIHPFREGYVRMQRWFWGRVAQDICWQLSWLEVAGEVNDAGSRVVAEGHDLRPLIAMLEQVVSRFWPGLSVGMRIVEIMGLPDDRQFPRYLSIPWTQGEESVVRQEHGLRLAVELAAELGTLPTAVVANKQMIPDGWEKLPYRTRRSLGNLHAGRIVEVHIWPTLEDLIALRPTATGHAIIIEHAVSNLSGWARHHGATHYDTLEVLTPETSKEALVLYSKIDWNGNNGWHDAPGKRDALRDLGKLKDLQELDGNDIAGYMIGRHNLADIRQLLHLIEQV